MPIPAALYASVEAVIVPPVILISPQLVVSEYREPVPMPAAPPIAVTKPPEMVIFPQLASRPPPMPAAVPM